MGTPEINTKFNLKEIPRRLDIARKLGAVVLDLELGFVDPNYQERFDSTLEKILEFNQEAAWKPKA